MVLSMDTHLSGTLFLRPTSNHLPPTGATSPTSNEPRGTVHSHPKVGAAVPGPGGGVTLRAASPSPARGTAGSGAAGFSCWFGLVQMLSNQTVQNPARQPAMGAGGVCVPLGKATSSCGRGWPWYE